MSESAYRVSSLLLIAGAVILAAAIVMLSLNPVIGRPLPPKASLLLLLGSIALLLSFPGMYARQSEAAGWVGLVGYLLLQGGLVLLVVLASTPLLFPAFEQAPGENPVVFFLGIALVLGLLLTGIAVIRAGVFPRWTGILMLAATAGFFFDFFIAEFLPPAAGQIGSAVFGVVLGLALAWIGLSLWPAS
jgi:hypothetical protein